MSSTIAGHQRTFVIYIEDRPGALDRVASLFRRRAFNIASLSVGSSELPGISRITAVVETDDPGAHRARAHLQKLVDVVRVDDISDRPSIVRDLALIRVAADLTTRSCMVQLAHVFNARIVEVSHDSLILEISGSDAKVDSLLEVLQPYGVLEMVRAGRIAMERRALADAGDRLQPAATVDEGISYSV